MKMNETAVNSLYTQLNIYQKPIGKGKTVPYVKSSDVFDRLNKVFDGGWSTDVFYQEIKGQDHVVGVKVTVYSEDGVPLNQTGFGSALRRYDNDEIGNLFKSALSKAIKNACSKWGIGLYLEEDVPVYDDTVDTQVIPKVPETSITSMPTFSIRTPASAPPPINTNVKTVVDTINVPTFAVSKPSPGPTIPELPKVPFALEQFKTPPVIPEMSGLPTNPKTGGIPIVSLPKHEANSVPTMPIPAEIKFDFISDIQMVALNTVLKYKMPEGMTYEDLIRTALTHKRLPIPNPIPPKEKLTYEQAMAAIKFGNDEELKKL